MFQIVVSDENRIDVNMSGKIDGNEMEAGLDELIGKSTGVTHGRMLYRIENFEFPSMRAFLAEFSRIPELFLLIKQFDKAAVIANEKWVRILSEMEGMLIPGFEVKAFKVGEEKQAEAWLTA